MVKGLCFDDWMRKKEILKNLLNYGYRAVANFHHSLDFFLKQFQEKNTMESYKKILENLLDDGLENSSQNNLRVESDINAVRIMTIHNSKGLEFPIVFCPYLWKPFNPRNKLGFFHSEKIDQKKKQEKILSYDLSKQNLYQQKIQEEQKAENRRLLYVLLTRAKHQIHLYYSEEYAASKKQSPFTELLEQLKKTEKFLKWNQCIEQFSLDSTPNFEVLQFPKTVLKPPKEWKRQITTIKESYSFSSLMSQKQTTPEKSSLEETQKLIPRKTINNETEFEALNEKEKISHLPSGIKIGNLVHQVLDSWQSPYQTQNNLIRNEQTKNFIRQSFLFCN